MRASQARHAPVDQGDADGVLRRQLGVDDRQRRAQLLKAQLQAGGHARRDGLRGHVRVHAEAQRPGRLVGVVVLPQLARVRAGGGRRARERDVLVLRPVLRDLVLQRRRRVLRVRAQPHQRLGHRAARTGGPTRLSDAQAQDMHAQHINAAHAWRTRAARWARRRTPPRRWPPPCPASGPAQPPCGAPARGRPAPGPRPPPHSP